MKISIKKLCVSSKDGKEILKDFNLNINSGEVHAIMGPNGTGKSTLSKVIMASNEYIITSGDILIDNKSIKGLSTDEIARLGVFLAFQSPISIDGVTNSEFLRTAYNSIHGKNNLYEFVKEIDSSTKDLKMDNTMIHRSINKDFSGGERKKNEILQMKVLKPKFIIFDELDSGLDVDSLKIVCKNVNNYIKDNPDTSLLIITHYKKILDLIKPDFVHIMKNGCIVKTGDSSLASIIEEKGYIDYE